MIGGTRIRLPRHCPPGMGDALLPAAVAFATGVFLLSYARADPVAASPGDPRSPERRSSHSVADPARRRYGRGWLGAAYLACPRLAEAGLAARRSLIGDLRSEPGLLAIVCWIDDLRGLSPAILRLVAQAAAVTIGVLVLPQPHDLAELGRLVPSAYLAVIGLAWVWWVNLFNFMDGIDGLAGSEAAAIGAGLLLFAALRRRASILRTASLAAAIDRRGDRVFAVELVAGADLPRRCRQRAAWLFARASCCSIWRSAAAGKSALILPLYFLADATITLLPALAAGRARVAGASRAFLSAGGSPRPRRIARGRRTRVIADRVADRLRLGGGKRLRPAIALLPRPRQSSPSLLAALARGR